MDDLTGISVLHAHGASLAEFTGTHAATVDQALADHGAVLVRGASASGADSFQQAVSHLGFEPLEYTERSTPRNRVTGGVYTSTEYPARQVIPQHCESSYATVCPGRLAFFCAVPAESGGATPITDVSGVLDEIPTEVVQEFENRGVRYVRNYGNGAGLDWREAFQTDDRSEVDRYCAANGLERSWMDNDCLRTVRQAPALVVHPRTGKRVWFNHLVLFHPSSLPGTARADLVELFGPDGLPNDVRFGDGSEIPDDLVEIVRAAFERRAQRFDWLPHDLLVIDNMRWSHGREPFTGDRRVLVSMSDPVTPV